MFEDRQRRVHRDVVIEPLSIEEIETDHHFDTNVPVHHLGDTDNLDQRYEIDAEGHVHLVDDHSFSFLQ